MIDPLPPAHAAHAARDTAGATKRATASALVAAALLLATAGQASAQGQPQGWPERPVRVIVASVAGGTVDVSFRTLMSRMAERFKQPFVIDNRGGAGGTIAAEAVARAAPDGYTLLGGSIADQVINVFIRRNANQALPYNPERDLAPVALVERGGNALVAHPSFPAGTLAQLIALAKSRPGSVTFGSGGIGQTSHLSGELFMRAAGISLLHVPYRGNAPASSDLLAGNINLLFESAVSAEPNIRAGRVKPLAVTTPQRLAGLPDVPTFVELGFPNMVVTPYILLLAPAGVSPAIVQALNRATVEIMNGPGGRTAARAALGWETPDWTTAQLNEFIVEDRKRWEGIIMGSSIKGQ